VSERHRGEEMATAYAEVVRPANRRVRGEVRLLASRLRMLRTRAKLTQLQVAEAIGVERKTVVAWERTDRMVRPASVYRLADLFRVAAMSLVSEEFRGMISDELPAGASEEPQPAARDDEADRPSGRDSETEILLDRRSGHLVRFLPGAEAEVRVPMVGLVPGGDERLGLRGARISVEAAAVAGVESPGIAIVREDIPAINAKAGDYLVVERAASWTPGAIHLMAYEGRETVAKVIKVNGDSLRWIDLTKPEAGECCGPIRGVRFIGVLRRRHAVEEYHFP
jgi:transcriptional regulator with XRE-family HTH domain